MVAVLWVENILRAYNRDTNEAFNSTVDEYELITNLHFLHFHYH